MLKWVEERIWTAPRPSKLPDAASHAPAVHPPADFGDQRLRAPMAEFGIVAPVGRKGVEQLLAIVTEAKDQRVPELARACIAALGAQLRRLKEKILEFDRRIMAWHRSNETSRRLDELPGVGPALATALVASVPDPK